MEASASRMGISMSTPDKSAGPPPTDLAAAAAAAEVAAPASAAPHPQRHRYAESNHNLALLDPARFGWTAAGGVVDLTEPHERARRRAARATFLRELKRKRDPAEPFAVLARPPPKQSAPSSARDPDADSSVAVRCEPDVSVDRRHATMNDSATPDNAVTSEATSNGGMDPILFSARTQANTLDIYTYHRGREGFELRDPKRGDLLCDVAATDTNYGRDEVNSLVARVLVQFPLQPAETNGDQWVGDERPLRYFQEIIEWDLMDVETPPPSVFAARIGEQFGLSLAETLDLTESIQDQLYSFVSDHAGYSPALPVKDVFGQPRDAPPPSLYALYGDVLGPHRGGLEIPKRPGKARVARQTIITKSAMNGQSRAAASASDRHRQLSSKNQCKKPALVKQKGDSIHAGEIRKRLLENSRRLVREGGVNRSLKIMSECACHICQKMKEKVAVPACGHEKHACCIECLNDSLGISVTFPDSGTLDYCPVCSLVCTCDACEKRLGHLVYEFKQICKKRKSAVCETEFRGLFELALDLEIHPKEAAPPSNPTERSGKARFGMLRAVAKVPLSKLPDDGGMTQNFELIEMLGLKQMEAADGAYFYVDDWDTNASPSKSTQYEPAVNGERTCSFSKAIHSHSSANSVMHSDKANGHIDNDKPSFTVAAATIEDGSVDHCILCMQCGDLLCCDKCPRAYHARCIKDIDLEGEPWECPACRREAAGTLEEKLDGGNYLSSVVTAFAGKVDTKSRQVLTQLKILSIICEMLQYLMEYDFGYMFSAPVDTKDVPSYNLIVKEPMDFGTISNKLLKGGYEVQKAEKSLETVIVAALNDINLVWHNCFLFNAPGSAIFRMAEVQKATADRIRMKSLEDLLSSFVKDAVREYWESCEIVHRQPLRLNNPHPVFSSRRKASAKSKEKAKGIPIIVLDPEHGRIVKIYLTTASAIAAVDMLLGLGYPCEWDFSEGPYHTLVIRRIIKESASRSNYRLFGYRWLQLPDYHEKHAAVGGLGAEETASQPFMATDGSEQPPTPEYPMNETTDTDTQTTKHDGNG